MTLTALCAFIFLGSSFLSLWIKKDPKIWGTLLACSLILGMFSGLIHWVGLSFILALALLWFFYAQKPNALLFLILVLFGISFKLRLITGFSPFFITPKFAIGLENPLIGLFPLALLVPLSKSFKDWKLVIKGLLFGIFGIAILAFLATISHATTWDFKLPSHAGIRILSNLILTCIPEEGFYRGFIQKKLAQTFSDNWKGKALALILTSLLFAFSHILWSANIAILAFTFLTGLLYGGVYLFSGKIESAILCHFLFNLVHMTFFSYHAD